MRVSYFENVCYQLVSMFLLLIKVILMILRCERSDDRLNRTDAGINLSIGFDPLFFDEFTLATQIPLPASVLFYNLNWF